LKLEVLGPVLFSRVKQFYDTFRVGVDAREVWSLVTVAVRARKSEVALVVGPAVLPRDNVLDLVAKERFLILTHATVLATLLRSVADESPSLGHTHEE
jgi:hypothetical protein